MIFKLSFRFETNSYEKVPSYGILFYSAYDDIIQQVCDVVTTLFKQVCDVVTTGKDLFDRRLTTTHFEIGAARFSPLQCPLNLIYVFLHIKRHRITFDTFPNFFLRKKNFGT